MERNGQARRYRLISLLPLSLLLAACAGPAPTPSPSASAPAPSAAPTVIPTPLPEPPLALLVNNAPGEMTGEMKVVNSQGVEQWGLSAAEMEQMTGETAQQLITQGPNVSPQADGPNVLLNNTPAPPDKGVAVTELLVLSRTGKRIGTWAEPLGGNHGSLITSPSGTEWTWNVFSGMDKSGRQYGQVDISGLGEPVRTLFHWVAPVGFTDVPIAWTSAGITLQRIRSNTSCSPYTGAGTAAFMINPTTGALSDLFSSGGEQYLDIENQDTVAWLSDDEYSVVINGVIYSESGSLVAGAFVYNGLAQVGVSPASDHVAVNRVSQNDNCNGATPEASIEMVTVPDQSHIDLPNLSFVTWWNDREFVALTSNQSVWLYTVQGKAVSEISADPAWSFWGIIGG
jgi:hypothetical protein